MKKKLPTLLSLFLSFLKIGAFTFGGGYAMIALLENEFVSRKRWMEKDEFLDMLGVAESTPGPIAVNTATYIGYKVAGVLGAVLATLAVCLPAFSVIFVISLFFDRFLSLKYVGYAFRGIQVAVVYLIASAGLKVFKGLKKTPFSVLLCASVFLCFILFSFFAVRFSSIFFILIGGVLGLAGYFVSAMTKHGKKEAEPLLDPSLSAEEEQKSVQDDPQKDEKEREGRDEP